VVRAVNVIAHLQLQLCVLLQQVHDLLLLEGSLFQDDYGVCPLSRGAGHLESERIKPSANTEPALAGGFEAPSLHPGTVADTLQPPPALMRKPPPQLSHPLGSTHPKTKAPLPRSTAGTCFPSGNTGGFLGEARDADNTSACLHLHRHSQRPQLHSPRTHITDFISDTDTSTRGHGPGGRRVRKRAAAGGGD